MKTKEHETSRAKLAMQNIILQRKITNLEEQLMRVENMLWNHYVATNGSYESSLHNRFIQINKKYGNSQ